MRISQLVTIALLLVIAGCGRPEKATATAPSDEIVTQLIAFSPINGFWVNEDFAGEFTDLRFIRQSEREKGQIVCYLEGKGELWSRNGTIPFTVRGQSIGAELQPKLIFADREVSGIGTVTRDAKGWPQCRMTFTYNGLEYRADLNCIDDRQAAKERVLRGDR